MSIGLVSFNGYRLNTYNGRLVESLCTPLIYNDNYLLFCNANKDIMGDPPPPYTMFNKSSE